MNNIATKSIYKLFHILDSIRRTNSRTGKEAILKEHEGNELLRYALNFLYNPYIVANLSTKKINKQIEPFDVGNDNFSRVDDVMRYIKMYCRGRDYDIYVVQNYINKLEDETLKQFAREIFTKSYKCGLTEKTINKVYGKDTIESFAVMLAESYAKKESKVTGKFYVTLKLDGNRCIAIKEDDKVKFFTRKGQAIEDMVELENELSIFPNGTVLDGELLLVNDKGLTSDALFRATQKVVRKDGEKKNLEFYAFDILSIEEFKNGKSKMVYEDRREKLESLYSLLGETNITGKNSFKFLKVLPVLYKGTNKNMISVLMKWAEENNYEGLMVNTAKGLYVTKRTADLLKVKKFKTADLLCVSYDKAIDGQFKDMLARINVEYKGSLVGVGSGFTIEEREYFTANPNEIVGKIIEVQFFEESKDEKTGQPSLRFPTFKGIRHDKGIDDVNYGE